MWEYPPAAAPKIGSPRSLVLAPTRELALQIESDAKDLTKYIDLGVECVVGGMDFQKQLDASSGVPSTC